MRRKLLIALGIVVALLVLGAVVYGPVQREAMKVPVVRGLDGVNRGDIPAVRAQFTPTALAVAGEVRVPVARLLDAAAGMISRGRTESPFRFGGFDTLRWEGDRATLDAVLILDYAGDDSPYRGVPLRRTVQLTLQQTGWFTWQIAEITADDPLFALILRGVE